MSSEKVPDGDPSQSRLIGPVERKKHQENRENAKPYDGGSSELDCKVYLRLVEGQGQGLGGFIFCFCRAVGTIRAVRAAVHLSLGLNPVSNNPAGATAAHRRKRVNGTFEAVEGITFSAEVNLKCLVVFVSTDVTSCHGCTSRFFGRIYAGFCNAVRCGSCAERLVRMQPC